MNLIDDLINQLNMSENIFIPSIVNEINMFVLDKLLNISLIFKNNFNKYHLLSNLVKLGLELENIIDCNRGDILSLQLNFISAGLFNPIINNIRNICLELNMELVEEYKNQINNLIDSNSEKYKEHKKNIKSIQINCFCRNINYTIHKEIIFEDFGITIKITNFHYKDIFRDLIMESNLFVSNNNYKDKRFDWFWKANDYNPLTNINNYQEQTFNNNNNIQQNTINDENNMNNMNNEENNMNNENNEENESFKIIQKKPEIIGQKRIIKSQLDLNSNLNIIKPSEEQMSKIVSNSIIIEDDSFSILIDDNEC